MVKQEDFKPEDGAYVFGLFIEGAKWNAAKMEMSESDPKVINLRRIYLFNDLFCLGIICPMPCFTA